MRNRVGDDLSLRDFDRPLNERGRIAADLIGEHLASQSIWPEAIYCSPAVRTRETFSIMSKHERPKEIDLFKDKDLYLASAKLLHEKVRGYEGASDSVMLIGHNPGMHEFACRLAGSGSAASSDEDNALLSGKFPTAALAFFDVAINGWSEFKAPLATLRSYVTPKRLMQMNPRS